MIYAIVVGFVILTILYVIISVWARSMARENLEEEWDEEIRAGDRDAFIEEGMRDYDRSLRKKLVLGVYVVPMALVLILIYVTNYM